MYLLHTCAGQSQTDMGQVQFEMSAWLTSMGLLGLNGGVANALRAILHDQQDEQAYCNAHNARSIHPPPGNKQQQVNLNPTAWTFRP